MVWNRLGIYQPGFAKLLIGISPSVKAGSADAKIPTGFADLLGVLKHPKIALNIALLVRHQNFLHPKTGNLQEVSRESVHIYNLEAVIDQNPVLEARTALDKSAQHFGRKKPTVRPEFIPFNIFIHANV